jgi:acetate kinase
MESVPLKETIKSCLSGLFDYLEKWTTDAINSFKSSINLNMFKRFWNNFCTKGIENPLENRESTIDIHIKYIQEEIKIRIQSIKENLDELFEKFKDDLVEIKKEIINWVRNTNIFQCF